MKSQVIIRADGSQQIGLGHLVRCTSLAYMLIADFEITFVCKEIPESIKVDLLNGGFQVLIIQDEIQFFERLLPEQIVVIDGYTFDGEYQRKIKDRGCRLACVDDLHDKEFVADLIINHSPGVEPANYKALPQTQFALGLDYALLRPSFLRNVKYKGSIEKFKTLFICFGGSDLKNLTYRTLKEAIQFSEFDRINVVTGVAFKITDEFNQLVRSDERIKHQHNLNEEQMMSTMSESDLAIVPSSGILLETMATGCVVISGMYVDNQKIIYEKFVESGYIVDCGDFTEEKINSSISAVIAGAVSPITDIIDGESRTRLLKIFKQIDAERNIDVRKASASASDLELTFNWASSSEIRKYSFSRHCISKTEHSNWFNSKLCNPNCFFYIIEYFGAPIGSIRFDIIENEAWISYLLDPSCHGKGLGIVLLKMGIQFFVNDRDFQPNLATSLAGYVLKVNIPSMKAFERLGFEIQSNDNDVVKFTKNI